MQKPQTECAKIISIVDTSSILIIEDNQNIGRKGNIRRVTKRGVSSYCQLKVAHKTPLSQGSGIGGLSPENSSIF